MSREHHRERFEHIDGPSNVSFCSYEERIALSSEDKIVGKLNIRRKLKKWIKICCLRMISNQEYEKLLLS